ncbi:MAG TPA: redoxin domain-containing protein [Candidatus Acidoferrales bacterium]|nr:redoxin domain-containing protein [Candidatus Acidoferrales bacterium]
MALGLGLTTAKAEPPPRATGFPKTLELGAAAPDFDLPGIDGTRHSLKDYAAAKVLMIVFTANHCKTAQSYEERLKQLVVDYQGKGVAVVAIAANDPEALALSEMVYSDRGDSFDEIKARASERGFNFPYLYDGDNQTAARAYGPVSTPHVFIFDEARRLRYVGRVDDSEDPAKVKRHDAREALDELLAGKLVSVPRTRTFGCSIKWSEKRASARREVEQMDLEPVTLETADTAGIKALVKNDSPTLRLINVWSKTCGPCLQELPELVKMNRMYRNGSFEVVTINTDDLSRSNQVLSILTSKKVACRNYQFSGGNLDALAEAIDTAWPGGLPFTILVAPGGRIVERQMGEIEAMKLRKAIAYFPGR